MSFAILVLLYQINLFSVLMPKATVSIKFIVNMWIPIVVASASVISPVKSQKKKTKYTATIKYNDCIVDI